MRIVPRLLLVAGCLFCAQISNASNIYVQDHFANGNLDTDFWNVTFQDGATGWNAVESGTELHVYGIDGGSGSQRPLVDIRHTFNTYYTEFDYTCDFSWVATEAKYQIFKITASGMAQVGFYDTEEDALGRTGYSIGANVFGAYLPATGSATLRITRNSADLVEIYFDGALLDSQTNNTILDSISMTVRGDAGVGFGQFHIDRIQFTATSSEPDYFFDYDGDADPVVVPEPLSVILVAAGLAAAFFKRK